KEKRKLFTLMLVPHSRGKTRHLTISKLAFSLAFLGFGLAIVILFFFLIDYSQMKNKLVRLRELERINQIQAEKILSLAQKIKNFSQTMQRLQELEQRIRSLAGVGGGEINEQKLGRGGPGRYLLLKEDIDKNVKSPPPFKLIGKIEENVEVLRAEAKLREAGFGEMEKVILEKKDLFASTPNIFPVQGWISSGYGQRRNPFSKRREFHQALDLVAPWGTPVKASAQGRVVYAGWRQAYGLTVEMEDGHGYSTVYSHLSRILVKKGAWVKKGEIIGRVGSSGHSTGPHLHFEVWFRGKTIDPLNLMVEPLGLGD
ncbi:MAG: peptidoglycan DD-metalloendopeptidase family protein, partial [bacterium]